MRKVSLKEAGSKASLKEVVMSCCDLANRCIFSLSVFLQQH